MQKIKMRIKRQLAKSQVNLNGSFVGTPVARPFDPRANMRMLHIPVHIA
jgi:hypothetical protein